MAIKRGLARGLDELIPDYSERQVSEKVAQQEQMISVNDIEPNRGQPRKHFNEEKLNELAESIKQHGIIEPIIVQKKDKRYEIIAGERRFRAARIAGLKEVPVVIKEFTDDETFIIALLENIQRVDLNPIEEAMAYQTIIEQQGMKQEDVAKQVSKERSTITNSMRLLKLSKPVIEMIASSELSEGHGRALLGIENEKDQFELAKKIIENGLSVRQVEKLVKEYKENKQSGTKPKKKAVNVEYKNAENKLKQLLGTKVEIKNKADNSGKIEIEYYSLDELDRIIEIINGR